MALVLKVNSAVPFGGRYHSFPCNGDYWAHYSNEEIRIQDQEIGADPNPGLSDEEGPAHPLVTAGCHSALDPHCPSDEEADPHLAGLV